MTNWITKPVSLSANALSDYTHISGFYEQLSDGQHEIDMGSSITTLTITANIVNDGSRIIPRFVNYQLRVSGSLSPLNVNETLEANSLFASSYKNQLIIVSSVDQTFQSQLVLSVQTSRDLWEWILVSNQGGAWNVVTI